MTSRLARAIALTAIFLLGAGGGALLFTRSHPAAIGAPFTLIDSQGRPRSDQEFRGRLVLIYFGYTHCPDVCPTSLQVLANALETLGPQAREFATLFITIDPEQDQPAALEGYAEQFNPDFIGLTGSPDDIARITDAFQLYVRKTSEGLQHSSKIYLLGRDGRFIESLSPDMPETQLVAALTNALAS